MVNQTSVDYIEVCLAFEMNSFKGKDESVVCFFFSLLAKPQLFDGVEPENQWKFFFFFLIPLVRFHLSQVVFHLNVTRTPLTLLKHL